MKRLDLIRQIEENGCVFIRHGTRSKTILPATFSGN